MKRVAYRELLAAALTHVQVVCQVIGCVVFIAIAAALAGCSRRYHDLPVYSPFGVDDYDNASVGRFKTSFIVDQIDTYYRGSNPGPIGVTTLVNIDDLYSTSTFGRMYAEQVMSELVMRGFDVVELRHADALQFLAPNGEFALSRDVSSLRRSRELGGILVGTYVVSPERVYVNARLIDPSSSMVLSAGSVEMSKSREIARLLRGGSMPGTLERIPVRHLGLATFPAALYPSQRYESEEAGDARSFNLPPAEPKIPVVQAPVVKSTARR